MKRRTLSGCALVALATLLGMGCAEPPPPAVPEVPEPVAAPEPAPEPAPDPAPAPEPAVDPDKVQRCGQNLQSELPIVEERMGEGERLVRLINNSREAVQARLLDEQRTPVYQGTLRIPSGTIGEFRVPAGVYMVRYRRQKTCDVMRGAPLILKGRNAGVEISIKPKFDGGARSKMKPVGEAL